MAPHADAIGVGLGEAAHGGDCVEHVDDVVGRTVGSARQSLRLIVTAVVRPEDDVPVPRQIVDIGDVALGRAVFIRWDIAMVEDNHRPTLGGRLAARDGQQGIDLQPVRVVCGAEPIVVRPGIKLLLARHLAAWVVAQAHRFDRQRVERGGGRERCRGRG